MEKDVSEMNDLEIMEAINYANILMEASVQEGFYRVARRAQARMVMLRNELEARDRYVVEEFWREAY